MQIIVLHVAALFIPLTSVLLTLGEFHLADSDRVARVEPTWESQADTPTQ